MQSPRCLGFLYYLSTLSDSDWTMDDVYGVDALGTLDRLLAYLEEASKCSVAQDDAMSVHIQLCKTMRDNWAAKLAEMQSGPAGGSGMVHDGAPSLQGAAQGMSDFMDLGFSADEWLFDLPNFGITM